MSESHLRWFHVRLTLCTVAIACLAGAGTIVSATGSGGADLLGGIPREVEFISWSSSNAYSGVTISAELGTFDPVSFGTAYLMNAIGPGATTANEIATATYTVHSSEPEGNRVPLFTGLSLPPGTYYLVVTGPMDGSWQPASLWRHIFENPSIVTDTGVTLNDWGYTAPDSVVNLAYPPASHFSIAPSPHLRFAVTAAELSVPEPATALPVGFALTILAALALRRTVQR